MYRLFAGNRNSISETQEFNVQQTLIVKKKKQNPFFYSSCGVLLLFALRRSQVAQADPKLPMKL